MHSLSLWFLIRMCFDLVRSLAYNFGILGKNHLKTDLLQDLLIFFVRGFFWKVH